MPVAAPARARRRPTRWPAAVLPATPAGCPGPPGRSGPGRRAGTGARSPRPLACAVVPVTRTSCGPAMTACTARLQRGSGTWRSEPWTACRCLLLVVIVEVLPRLHQGPPGRCTRLARCAFVGWSPLGSCASPWTRHVPSPALRDGAGQTVAGLQMMVGSAWRRTSPPLGTPARRCAVCGRSRLCREPLRPLLAGQALVRTHLLSVDPPLGCG